MLSKNRSPRTGLLKYGLCAPLFAIMLIFSAATVKESEAGLITKSKKITNSLIGSLNLKDEPNDYKSFLTRNPAVKELGWKINPYRVMVYLKNGKSEIYNLENPEKKQIALSKYGEFPYPPPPPPAQAKNRLIEVPLTTSSTIKGDLNIGSTSPAMSFKPLAQHISRTIIYPSLAKENQVTGNVTAKFSVKDYSLSDIRIVESPGYGLDEEVKKSLSNFNDHLILADGEYTLDIGFQLSGVSNNSATFVPARSNHLGTVIVTGYLKNMDIDASQRVQETPKDFASVEVLPEFPGGSKGLSNYLAQNITYPKEARDNNIQGRVFVSFIVMKDGTLTDVKVLRGLGYGLDEEAIRVVSESPKWKPGIQNGRPVQVQYTMPILFTLPKKVDLKSSTFNMKPPLYVIDGKQVSSKTFKSLNSASVKAITVSKDSQAIRKYGQKGKNGVIEISTKIYPLASSLTSGGSVKATSLAVGIN